MLKNRSITPAPNGPHERVAREARGVVDDAEDAEASGAPDRTADKGMSRIDDTGDGPADGGSGATDSGVGDPPTGEDPGPGPDSDDPMGGESPTG